MAAAAAKVDQAKGKANTVQEEVKAGELAAINQAQNVQEKPSTEDGYEEFDIDLDELDTRGPGSQVENVNATGVTAKEQGWLLGNGVNRMKTDPSNPAQQNVPMMIP